MNPSITTTASTVAQAADKTPPGFDFRAFLSDPIVLAIISSGALLTIIILLFTFIFKLGKFNKTISIAITDIDDLKKDSRKLLSHVDIMKTHLVTNSGLNALLFGPGSPLQLKSGGIKILDASGFKKMYAENKDWFIEEIKKHTVETLSDVDEASLKVLEKCKHEKKFADYKELAFENGISVDVLIRILAIYLRDQVADEILNPKKKATTSQS